MNHNQKITPSLLLSSQPLNKQIIKVENELMSLNVYWIFLRSSGHTTITGELNKHTFFEIQTMINGEMEMEIEENGSMRSYAIKTGELVVIPPFHSHQVVNSSSDGVRLNIAFNLESTDFFIQEAKKNIEDITIVNVSNSFDSFISILKCISVEESPWNSYEISSIIQCFLLRILSRFLPNETFKYPKNTKAVRSELIMNEMTSFISKNIQKKLSVADVSKYIGLSSRHLNRICKNCGKESINKLIAKEKLKYIKDLLATTPMSFSEIADMLGFSSEYALGRFFKTAEGYTMGQYRRLVTLS